MASHLVLSRLVRNQSLVTWLIYSWNLNMTLITKKQNKKCKLKKKNVSGLDRPLPPQGPWVVLLFLHRFHAPACVDTITEDAEDTRIFKQH